MGRDKNVFWLFSYGTLRQEKVQLLNFGRTLEGHADVLQGYALFLLNISDAQVVAASGKTQHPIARPTGNTADTVNGMVFRVNTDDLLQADAYEAPEYARVQVKLGSGRIAFAFVAQDAKAGT